MNKNLFKKVEDIFIIFCAFWGILFLFINPPFCASDETSHFYKMYGFINRNKIPKKAVRTGKFLS